MELGEILGIYSFGITLQGKRQTSPAHFVTDIKVKQPARGHKPTAGQELEAKTQSHGSSKADCGSRRLSTACPGQYDTKTGWRAPSCNLLNFSCILKPACSCPCIDVCTNNVNSEKFCLWASSMPGPRHLVKVDIERRSLNLVQHLSTIKTL